MKLAVFLVNTICRPINALFALADRDVCRWVELTDEEACESKVALRHGSAACDKSARHDGLHVQHVTGIEWTDEDATRSWIEVREL